MGKKEELIQRLLSVPKDFTFDEMQSLLEILGFELSNKGKTSGSREKFYNGKTIIILHKPHPQNELLKCQIKQIIKKLKENDLI